MTPAGGPHHTTFAQHGLRGKAEASRSLENVLVTPAKTQEDARPGSELGHSRRIRQLAHDTWPAREAGKRDPNVGGPCVCAPSSVGTGELAQPHH